MCNTYGYIPEPSGAFWNIFSSTGPAGVGAAFGLAPTSTKSNLKLINPPRTAIKPCNWKLFQVIY